MDRQRLANELLKIAKTLMAGNYEIYHKSYSDATTEAYEYAEKKGYTIDPDSWFEQVTTGRGKPKNGDTRQHHVALLRNGKETRKHLQFQVFDMGTGTYELNLYIS